MWATVNANRRCKYKLLLRGGIGELCSKIGLVQLLNTCWDYVRNLWSCKTDTPESRAGVRQFYEDWTNCILYTCTIWRGLSAFSGELDSLLRCAGSVGEAGASYVNKWSNRTEELFLLFPPLISATKVRYELVFVFPFYLVFTQNVCKSALYVSVRVLWSIKRTK